MKDVKVLFMAQPPMIKFRDPLSPIKIQLFIQSPLVELTANLMDAYYCIDVRAKQLLAAGREGGAAILGLVTGERDRACPGQTADSRIPHSSLLIRTA
jgi:hypothetical protein